MAGFVYDIDKIAAHCSVAADAKCWPVLLSNKKGAAALALELWRPMAGISSEQLFQNLEATEAQSRDMPPGKWRKGEKPRAKKLNARAPMEIEGWAQDVS